LFGYVGIHVTFPLIISNTIDCKVNSESDYTIMAEVQFHLSTIYDGTSVCLKERQHDAYRAFQTKEALTDMVIAARARSTIMMHYAYAMAITPLS
jgi:hypothetical protein